MRFYTKKFISGLLSLTLAASVATVLPVSSSAAGIAYGDINGDSVVNSNDALAALTYSVGLREFTSDEFIRADVNADKKVNSSDALDILKYSVGLIDRFKADESDNRVDAKVALEAYNKAITNSKSFLPSYTFKQTTESDVDDVKLSTSSPIISDSALKQLEDSIKADFQTERSTYSKIVKQKSKESANRMLGTFDVSRISELASVECTVKENGNYLLKIKFKDEKNSADNSPLVTVLNLSSYSDSKKAFEDGLSLEENGMTTSVSKFTLEYKSAYLECEINPTTSEFVSIDWSVLNNVDATAVLSYSIISLTIDMSTSGKADTSYSNFGY